MTIAIFIFLILYFVLTRIRLDWAVMLIIIALPAYLIRFEFLGIPATLLEAIILISFFSWFLFDTRFKDFIKGKYKAKDYFAARKKRGPYPFGMEIVLLLIVSLVSVGVAQFTDNSFGIWKAYFFEPILLFILILNVFQEREDIKKIVFSLGVGALIVSLVAIFQKFTGLWIANELWQAEETRRVVSFFGYPNAVGLFLAPITMILVGYLFKDFKNKNYLTNSFLIITIILSVLSVYFARSEGALAALVVALIVFGLLASKWWRLGTTIFLIIVATIILINPLLRDQTIKKVTLMDFSGQIRRQQWTETFKMLREGRVIQGSGLANYQKVISPYHVEGIFYDDGTDPDFHRHTVFNEEYREKAWRPVEIYLYPHNIILNSWTELGLAGALLFIWIIVRFFIKGFSIYFKDGEKYLTLGLIGAMLTIVIHGIVDVPYFKNDLASLFWTLLAIISLVCLNIKSSKKLKT